MFLSISCPSSGTTGSEAKRKSKLKPKTLFKKISNLVLPYAEISFLKGGGGICPLGRQGEQQENVRGEPIKGERSLPLCPPKLVA